MEYAKAKCLKLYNVDFRKGCLWEIQIVMKYIAQAEERDEEEIQKHIETCGS